MAKKKKKLVKNELDPNHELIVQKEILINEIKLLNKQIKTVQDLKEDKIWLIKNKTKNVAVWNSLIIVCSIMCLVVKGLILWMT